MEATDFYMSILVTNQLYECFSAGEKLCFQDESDGVVINFMHYKFYITASSLKQSTLTFIARSNLNFDIHIIIT